MKTLKEVFALFPRCRRFYVDAAGPIGLRDRGTVYWYRWDSCRQEYRLGGTTTASKTRRETLPILDRVRA